MPTQFRVGIIRFPGTNCDLDTWESVALVPGLNPVWVSHRERTDPGLSALILPGGFSYGDYLRTGSIAAQAPVMNLVIDYANQGLPVLGICNGFQILAETGLLPGVLLTNRNRTFICQEENLVIDRVDTPFTALFSLAPGSSFPSPIRKDDSFSTRTSSRRSNAMARFFSGTAPTPMVRVTASPESPVLPEMWPV